MPKQELQCPFCEQTSSRPQGLAAHVRNRHAKKYPKWLKTPSRLTDAGKSTVVPKAAEPAAAPRVQFEEEAPVVTSPQSVEANPIRDLLQKAHFQLIERKQNIETDLARLADLTNELETVNTQIQALDKTLGVFSIAVDAL